MAKWKTLTLPEDVTTGAAGELIGIEELECPDDFVVYANPKDKGERKKKRKRETVVDGKTGKLSKKKKKEKKLKSVEKPQTKKESQTFEGFAHHDEMTSWNGFGLREEILAALYDKNFRDPTEIQLRCLGPAVSGRRDILGAAETGSGKTLAFGIPMVQGILNLKERGASEEDENSDADNSDEESDSAEDYGCVKVVKIKTRKEKNKLLGLVLTPTRELAVQVKKHLSDICKYADVKIVLVVGGLAQEKQERLLRKRPEIIVATPGRLWELIKSDNVHLQNVGKVRYLAVDETDRMLEKGHFEELNNILEHINANEADRRERQNFVFSATLTMVHDPPSYVKGNAPRRITPGQKLQQLVDRIGMTNPKIVDITNAQITPESMREFKMVCKFEEKDYYLYHFLTRNRGKTIIFCNSIGCVKRLANLLNILNFSPLPLHASMMQKQRLKNLEKFAERDDGILIATDVAARGLDICDVRHVLHYQVPKTAETYVHRSGRTARRKNCGNVLLLIEPQEYKFYCKLVRTLGRSDEIKDLDVDGDTANHVKRIIHVARDIDQLTLAVKKQNSKKNWYSKALDEMDMVLDEDEMPRKISDEAGKRIKDDLNAKRKQLKALLNAPHSSSPHFAGKFPTEEVANSLLRKGRKALGNVPGAYVLKR